MAEAAADREPVPEGAGIFRLPWLHDRHNHVSHYASFLGCPTLAGQDGPQALATLRGLDPGRTSVVFGWHSARLPLGPRDQADLPPAILVNHSLHGYLITEAALPELAESQPDLVAHRADPEWQERHLPDLLETFSRLAGLDAARLARLMRGLEARGIGLADDLAVADGAALALLRQSPWGAAQCWATPAAYQAMDPDARRGIEGLKCFTDGALGARTAALGGPYRGGGQGLLLHRDEDLRRSLGEACGTGKALAIHAIGDRAIEQVLGILERLDRDGLRFPCARLEHVQVITPTQARRARDLGLVLSMQPNFTSDSVDYADRLEPRWLEANNPFRMLIDQAGFTPGRDLLFGSDGMPHGVEYALQWSLFPPFPGQRLTLAELVAGYGPLPERGWSRVAVGPGRVRLLESAPA